MACTETLLELTLQNLGIDANGLPRGMRRNMVDAIHSNLTDEPGFNPVTNEQKLESIIRIMGTYIKSESFSLCEIYEHLTGDDETHNVKFTRPEITTHLHYHGRAAEDHRSGLGSPLCEALRAGFKLGGSEYTGFAGSPLHLKMRAGRFFFSPNEHTNYLQTVVVRAFGLPANATEQGHFKRFMIGLESFCHTIGYDVVCVESVWNNKVAKDLLKHGYEAIPESTRHKFDHFTFCKMVK